jgi:hypothetical protein
MAHVTQQQELLTDARQDQCLQAAEHALAGIHAHPSEPSGGTITGAIGSYGMYDYHSRKHPEYLPLSLAVTVVDLGAQRRVRIVGESSWPFEALDEWIEADYRKRCEQLVTMLHGSIAEALTPVAV